LLKFDPYEKQDENLHSEHEIQSESEDKKTIRKDAFLSVTIDAFSSLMRSNPAQAAASISYYSLFSMFPLILFIIVILSFFLEYTVIQKEIILLFSSIIPGSETFIIENLQNILTNRTTTSINATITLLWSGSGAFNGIISNIHQAWPESKGRGYLVNRLFAILGIILIIVTLIAISMGAITLDISKIIPLFDLHVSRILGSLLDILLQYVLPILLLYAACFLLYYHVPAVEVDKQAARIGAWLTSLTMRVFTGVFGLFILSPLNKYDLVYGSLTSIILLLLYIFFSALIILFSAHLVAAITHYKIKKGIPFYQHQEEKRFKTKAAKTWKRFADYVQLTARKIARWAEDQILHTASRRPQFRKHIERMKSNGKLDQIRQVIKDFFASLFRWK
jgi:YihY family inner membrane protein